VARSFDIVVSEGSGCPTRHRHNNLAILRALEPDDSPAAWERPRRIDGQEAGSKGFRWPHGRTVVFPH
jgi:hypothetical protein